MATKRLLVCVFLNLLFHTANCFTGKPSHDFLHCLYILVYANADNEVTEAYMRMFG